MNGPPDEAYLLAYVGVAATAWAILFAVVLVARGAL